MYAKELEQSFLDFFVSKNYREVNEISLIPKNDDSLLFTNSGMVQFKDIFLGLVKPECEKAVTIQTCIRLSGKHDDLENIGLSPHHNTSFKMLGNFGFVNINKSVVINEAVEFLVDRLNLDFTRFHVSVHQNDLESRNIWLATIGIHESKVINGSDETNMWSMDNTGPCGYCTEIFYKLDNGELLEIWNLVFIQYNRTGDKLLKLKNVFLDTGMGLERILSVKQKTYDNFDTDIYKPMLNVLSLFFKTNGPIDKSFRILVDHMKTSVLLMKENVLPGNDKRNYVLKKLIRRAILAKNKMGVNYKLYQIPDDFFFLIDNFIGNNLAVVKEVLKLEEKKLLDTVKFATGFLKKKISSSKNVTSQDLFKLYDTYGMPFDIIKKLTSKYKINFNINEFNSQMNKQINLSKNVIRTADIKLNKLLLKDLHKTNFRGYGITTCESSILCMIFNNVITDTVFQDQTVIILTESTPFYPEKGGQVGDEGMIICGENIMNVFDVQEIDNKILHYCYVVNGSFKVNSLVSLKINKSKRLGCKRNHSATHLLHSVLKKVLGPHVKQMGSLVTDKYLRFDFIHFSSLSNNEIISIEDMVNDYIKMCIKTYVTSYFDENKNETIRTIVIGDKSISSELCAGTHVKNTRDIFFFKIFKEHGIGSNIRRIEAGTAYNVIDKLLLSENTLVNIISETKSNRQDILENLKKLLLKNKTLEKENAKIMSDLISYQLKYSDNAILIKDIKLCILVKDNDYLKFVHQFVNDKQKLIVLYYFEHMGYIKLNLVLSKDLTYVNLLGIINELEKYFPVKGGGSKGILKVSISKNDCTDINGITDKIVSYLSSSI